MNNLNRLATNIDWYGYPSNNNNEEDQECSHPLCNQEAVTLFDDKHLCNDHYFNWCDKCIDDGIYDGVWMDVDEYEEFVSRNDEPLDRIPYINTFSGILNNKQINDWRPEQDALPRLSDNTRLFKLYTCVDADGKKRDWSIKLGNTSILCEHHAKEEEDAAREHIIDVMGKKGKLFNKKHLRKIRKKKKRRANVPSLKTLATNALSTKNIKESRQYVLASPNTLKNRKGGRKRKTHKKKRRQRKSKKKRKAKK
jgi:hypothetical protein